MNVRKMNIGKRARPILAVAAIATLAVLASGRFPPGSGLLAAARVARPIAAPAAPAEMPLGLPAPDGAKDVLNAALTRHHAQWVDVPAGSARGAATIRTYVMYPNQAGAAPVVVVTAAGQGLSDWVRAVGAAAVNDGMIAVVPDVLSGAGPRGGGTESFAGRDAVAAALARLGPAEIARRDAAVRDYFLAQPGANGKSAVLDFDWAAGSIDVAVKAPALDHLARFDFSEHAWHNTLALLWTLAEPAAPPQQSGAAAAAAAPAPQMAPDGLAAAAANQAKAQQAIAARNDFPPQTWGARRMVDESPRKGQWIDIPITTQKEGVIKMHTWLVQPLGADKAGVVVVIQPTPGMDLGEVPRKGDGAYWMRSVADQIALQGFIVIMPDLTSGLGPNGGNFDSFIFPDDLARAEGMRPASERMEFVAAARDYALKLPRANGKSATLGFCSGGSLSWQAAADVPGLNAAVSFYGTPPDAATMAKIGAPVIAFAGDQDPGLAPRVAAAAPLMQKLGKAFEFSIYPGTTHAYLYEQHLGQNAAATLDSWPRSMQFLKRYLKGV